VTCNARNRCWVTLNLQGHAVKTISMCWKPIQLPQQVLKPDRWIWQSVVDVPPRMCGYHQRHHTLVLKNEGVYGNRICSSNRAEQGLHSLDRTSCFAIACLVVILVSSYLCWILGVRVEKYLFASIIYLRGPRC
jgi:hypothetical protein